MGFLKKRVSKKTAEQEAENFKYVYHQMALDSEAYEIVCKIKRQLIIKNKRPFNFSDAIRELKAKGEKIED